MVFTLVPTAGSQSAHRPVTGRSRPPAGAGDISGHGRRLGTEQSRGAPLKPLDDPTPLTGPTIDVGVRIGWLLRMARLTAPERPAHRLGDMVTRLEWQGLRTSTSSLHRVDTGAVGDDRVEAAYEEALRAFASVK